MHTGRGTGRLAPSLSYAKFILSRDAAIDFFFFFTEQSRLPVLAFQHSPKSIPISTIFCNAITHYRINLIFFPPQELCLLCI